MKTITTGFNFDYLYHNETKPKMRIMKKKYHICEKHACTYSSMYETFKLFLIKSIYERYVLSLEYVTPLRDGKLLNERNIKRAFRYYMKPMNQHIREVKRRKFISKLNKTVDGIMQDNNIKQPVYTVPPVLAGTPIRNDITETMSILREEKF